MMVLFTLRAHISNVFNSKPCCAIDFIAQCHNDIDIIFYLRPFRFFEKCVFEILLELLFFVKATGMCYRLAYTKSMEYLPPRCPIDRREHTILIAVALPEQVTR